jgi:hypothetical protein
VCFCLRGRYWIWGRVSSLGRKKESLVREGYISNGWFWFFSAVMPTAKKAGSARRTTSRKPLADRTNDSPIYGLTPCGNKTGGGRKSSPIYERTPISKLRSFKSCTPGTPGEEILRSQVSS